MDSGLAPYGAPRNDGQWFYASGNSSLILHVEAPELLQPLSGLHLGGVDVALPVGGDVVERGELADLAAGPAEARQRLLRDAVDDAHLAVHAVDHVDEGLRLVGREHQIVDGAVAAR